jgi:hypothetical protein
MQFFTLRNGEEAFVIDGIAIIDYCMYQYEDLADLIKNGTLTIDEHSVIANAIFNDETTEEEINENARNGNFYVRLALAKLGYAPDILVSDPADAVRAEVAGNGYGLEKLINDPEYNVRYMVAQQGYGLDILVNDPDYMVRESVAEQGFGLEKLINDPSPYVRGAVAKQGYGLDILINDKDLYVRNMAKDAITEQKMEMKKGTSND